jgi:DNA modification methylase
MPTPYYRDDTVELHHGDCLDVLRTLPDASVDSVVTDPPYGLGFMGKAWDDLPPGIEFAAECLRVLKPGGHLLAFGGSRTWHRLAAAVEDAGFEIRDSIAWLYGSGFPKSLDVSKAIDRAAGAERSEVAGKGWHRSTRGGEGVTLGRMPEEYTPGTSGLTRDLLAPATDAARTWQGWGTALKPAFEPIVVGRKPLIGTVAANVQAHGTGALNVDGCRVGMSDEDRAVVDVRSGSGATSDGWGTIGNRAEGQRYTAAAAGRWPTNVVLDESQAAELDRQSGERPGFSTQRDLTARDGTDGTTTYGAGVGRLAPGMRQGFNDSGGASRFFPTFRYEAKAPTSERPTYWTRACECEEACPTTSRPRGTSATAPPCGCSTSKPGSSTTDGPCLTVCKSTTSTATSGTTTPPTSSPSAASTTSASTPGASSAEASGGSRAGSAGSSSPSARATGTSAGKGGPSTADAARATSPAWSATSVCGSCGAPAKRESHATVKPLDLMRWLVRLVTPPGGVVLEPFAGSGTTAEACVIEGFRCIAIEREADYLPLIVARLTKPIEMVLDFGDVS